MKKSGNIFTHITGWIILLLLPVLFITGQNEYTGIAEILLSPYYWLFLFCYAVLFYSHTYFVFPLWYSKKIYVLYAGYLVIRFLLILFIQPFDKLVAVNGMPPGRGPWSCPPGMRGPRRKNSCRHCKYYFLFPDPGT